jgi:tetratricopeptide (TPR) repeat protein
LLEKEAKKIEEDASIKKVRDKKIKIAELAKKTKDIEPYLKKAIEIKPDIEDACKYLGNYYMRCQNKEEALKIYKLLVEKFPNSPQLSTYKKIVEDIEKMISNEKKGK